jgi:hypothetical protein
MNEQGFHKIHSQRYSVALSLAEAETICGILHTVLASTGTTRAPDETAPRAPRMRHSPVLALQRVTAHRRLQSDFPQHAVFPFRHVRQASCTAALRGRTGFWGARRQLGTTVPPCCARTGSYFEA